MSHPLRPPDWHWVRAASPASATIWGTPEVVSKPVAGLLMRERSAAAAAEAIKRLLDDPPERSETRAYAEGFSWDQTSAGQLALFRSILGLEPETRPKDTRVPEVA